MEDENGIIGAMFTQVIDGDKLIDAKPWREQMLESTKQCSFSLEVEKYDEPIKQFLRVSTKAGGTSKAINRTMPGVTLRDFALNVAISQGITKVTLFFVSFLPLFLISIFYKGLGNYKSYRI